MNDMDAVDAKQQEQIETLQRKAEDNRSTDRWQWVVILSVAVGLLLYVNMALVSLIRSQSETISYFRESCGGH